MPPFHWLNALLMRSNAARRSARRRGSAPPLLSCERLEPRALLAAVGSEFLVNPTTAGSQTIPVTAMDAAGNFVVVWESDQGGEFQEIYGQRFNAAGVPQGSEFHVNTFTTGLQIDPAVAMDDDGDFVVAWRSSSQDGSGSGIYAQRYSAAGTRVGNEFPVNTTTFFQQNHPAVAMDSDGDFVIAWEGYGDGSIYGIYAQRYNKSGALQGGEFAVNTTTAGQQAETAVAMDAAGNFVVTWTTDVGGEDKTNISAQRFSLIGEALGTEFRVNSFTTDFQTNSTIAMQADGEFVVAWQSYTQDGGGYGIYAQRYSAGAVKQGAEFRVNTFTTGSQSTPEVATDDAGGFVVAWKSGFEQAGPASGSGIYAQRYNATGVRQEHETQIHTSTQGNQSHPSIAMDADGDYIVAWDSFQLAGGDRDIFAQRFARTPPGGLPPVIGAVTTPQSWTENTAAKVLAPTATLTDPDSANFATGKLTVAYTAGSQGSDRLTIRNQGTNSGQVGVSGSNVTFGGVVVGTFAGGTGAAPLVVTFNAAATPVIARSVLRNVLYANVSDNPTNFGAAPTRTLRYTLTDGDGGASAPVSQTLNVVAVADAPVIGAFDPAVTYTENGTGILVDSNATVADPDTPSFNGGRLNVALTANGQATDRLTIRNQGTAAGQIGVSGANVTFGGTVIGTFTGGTGTTPLVVTFNAASTPAAAQALLRNVLFSNVSDTPSTAPRTVRAQLLAIAAQNSNQATKTINVTAVNDASVVGAFADASSYKAGAGPTLLDTNATVADVDSTDFNGGTLTLSVSSGGALTNRLGIRNQGTAAGQIGVSGNTITVGGTAIGTFTGGTGTTPLVVTFNAAAKSGGVQVLVRNLTFQSTTASPTGPKTIRLALRDGDGGLATVDKTLNITP